MSHTVPLNGEITKRELDITEADCAMDPDGLLDQPDSDDVDEGEAEKTTLDRAIFELRKS